MSTNSIILLLLDLERKFIEIREVQAANREFCFVVFIQKMFSYKCLMCYSIELLCTETTDDRL